MRVDVHVIAAEARTVLATHTVEAETVGALARRTQALQRQYGDGVVIDDADADDAVRRLQGLPPFRDYITRAAARARATMEQPA